MKIVNIKNIILNKKILLGNPINDHVNILLTDFLFICILQQVWKAKTMKNNSYSAFSFYFYYGFQNVETVGGA